MTGLRNLDLDKKRWIILALSCIVSLCTGSLYAWSVFGGPMEEHLNSVYHAGVAAGGFAIVFTTVNAVNPVIMIPGGWLNDRIGPRRLMFIGGILMGGALVLVSFASKASHLILFLGLPYGIGFALVYGCNINNCVKWFPEKKGFASGLVASFHGASAVLQSPFINMLIQHFSVMSAFRIIGIIFIGILCVSALFMQKVPDGYQPASMKGSGGNLQKTSAGRNLQARDYTGSQMIRTAEFRIMWAMFFCGSMSAMMCIAHAASLAQNLVQMSAAAAAVSVSVIAVFNTGGRIAAGVLSDRIGRLTMLLIGFFMGLGGFALLLLISIGAKAGPVLVLYYIGVCLFGFGYGIFVAVYPAFTADVFGVKNNSFNFNIMFTANAAAGLLGPVLMYRIYNAAGGYTPVFFLCVGVLMTGLILTLFFRKTARKKQYI